MAQWGNTDVAGNSCLWGVTGYNGAPNTTNRSSFYDNITPDAFVTGITAGQFGANAVEMGVASGPVAQITITNAGTGYVSNSTITFTGGGGTSAAATGTANSFGKISGSVISNAGTAYGTNPTISFAAPANTAFNGNTAITGGPSTGLTTDANSTITVAIVSANNFGAAAFKVGDTVKYRVDAGNTVVGGLTTETIFFIQHANTTKIALAATSGGNRITLTKSAGTDPQAGHFLQGTTATGAAVVGGAKNKGVTHAGWVVRTAGTGGRAGRVQYETLVAMGSITGDGSDDDVLPDS
jgi:hypothetical protein